MASLYHWHFMPYVAVAAAAEGTRQALAARRWAAILTARPDLEPAVRLQEQLLRIVFGLAGDLERRSLPRLSLPPRYLAAKLSRGVPAWTGEPIPVPTALLKPGLVRLCEALAAGGAGEAADHIRTAIVETRLDPTSLLTASLARDHEAIRVGATHRGLAPDLVWLVAELAVSPFACALHRAWLSPTAESSLAEALTRWTAGYCPACGSWPALGEAAAGQRVLRCSFCAYAWELPGYSCIYCGESGERFVTAAPDEERRDRRLELCGRCSSYLKTVDVPELSPFPLLAIADLETMDLDVSAMERGYSRPALKEVAPKKNETSTRP
jgi:FdhE protein